MAPKKFALVTATLLTVLVAASQAAVLSESNDAPVSSLISQPLFDGGIGFTTDFSDNAGPPGQTFLVGSGSITVTAITVKGNGIYGGFEDGGNPLPRYFVISLSSVAGSALNRVHQEVTQAYIPLSGTGYMTFTLDTPVVLTASSLYEFDIYQTDTSDPNVQSSNGGYYGFAKSSNDAYLDGIAMQNNGSGFARTSANPSTVTNAQAVDRTFFIQGVPEPTTCVLLTLGGMAGLLLRRRRMTE